MEYVIQLGNRHLIKCRSDTQGLNEELGRLKPGSQYVAQLRGAVRRGAARCLRRFVNTQSRKNRAAPRRAAPRREDRPEF